MTVSVVLATYGSKDWADLAMSNAYPTVAPQATEVVVYHDPTGTLARARNTGAARAHCDWLCFVDADDQLDSDYIHEMRPESLAQQAAHHPEHPWALLAPAVTYVDDDGNETPPAVPNAGRWPDLNECVIGTLVPRVLFELVGGFTEWPSLEDYELWLRCVKAGAEIVHVPRAVYRARAGHRRNADQSPYQQIRELHREVFE